MPKYKITYTEFDMKGDNDETYERTINAYDDQDIYERLNDKFFIDEVSVAEENSYNEDDDICY